MALSRAARQETGPRAGESLHAAYELRKNAWLAARRRSAFLSALWWLPALGVLGYLADVLSRIPAFGVIYFALCAAAVLDVVFRKPVSLTSVRARATAESGTGRILRSVEIRGRAVVLHDRILGGAGDPFEVEHVVLSPRGAFLVDTKQWHGHGVRMLAGDMFVDRTDQAPMFKELAEHARVLGEALTAAAGHDEEVGIVDVIPVLSVHADSLIGTPRTMHGVIIVTPEQLPTTLLLPDVRWSPGAVQSIVAAGRLLLLPKDATRVP